MSMFQFEIMNTPQQFDQTTSPPSQQLHVSSQATFWTHATDAFKCADLVSEETLPVLASDAASSYLYSLPKRALKDDSYRK